MIDKAAVKAFLLSLQNSLCNNIESLDTNKFNHDPWQKDEKDTLAGMGITKTIFSKRENNMIFAKGGVNFSHVYGKQLPPAATQKRNNLNNSKFEAMGVSAVLHPHNPYVPTAHFNVRFIYCEPPDSSKPTWWFGGGFDLTPCYGFVKDCIHWHQTAKDACNPFSPAVGYDIYERFKKQCDDYFFLPHRDEPRGIGGLFFDDFNALEFSDSFALVQSIANHFIPAYLPIVERRKELNYTSREIEFQKHRRARYVEFNLLHDRGTLFGIQSKGRVESILMSMPPEACWTYNWAPELDSPEAKLLTDFLVPFKQWI